MAGVSVAEGLQITSVRAGLIETHSVGIEWTTNIPSNGRIDYGEDIRNANRVALAIEVDTAHRTMLFGLREGEEHTYRLFASDTEGRQIRTNWLSFRTRGIPDPRAVQVQVKNRTWQGGEVEWVSNIAVKGQLECGYDTQYGYSQKESAFGTVHQVTLDRFSPRKNIYYRITAKDARGKSIPTVAGFFQTDELNIAKGAPVKGTFYRNPDRPYIPDTPPLMDRVTDGNTGYFLGMATSGDPDLETQWVEVDLGSIKDVSEILSVWRRLACPEKFSVKGSLDGDRWYEFGDTFSALDGRPGVGQTGDPIYTYSVSIGQYALRFIRLEIPMGAPYYKKFDNYNFVQLFELKAYPPETDDLFIQMLKKTAGKKK